MFSTPSHTIEVIASIVFAAAIVHTFSTKFFEHLAHTQPQHAGFWHLLGEVEIVFGFWAMVLMVLALLVDGQEFASHYLDTRNFTEPMFVFAIMVVAASKPILDIAGNCIRLLARYTPFPGGASMYFVILTFTPILGSFITEPAAMTLAALLLRDTLFAQPTSTRVQYATLGVLFVNISIGGTLTHFAATPVLMVAAKWDWGTWFMMTTFGWKAALAVVINSAAATALFRNELKYVPAYTGGQSLKVPASVIAVHIFFLIAIVLFSHHSAACMGTLMFFLGFATAYKQYQNKLMLREGLLVAFFLAGLVVLGGLQQWWLQPLLMGMKADTVFLGATALTAVTDNAALTYLGSLVEGLSPDFKVALVAGAVTGGGLTVIANAPNPAGVSILKDKFAEGAIHPIGLLIAALPPTLVAMMAFRLL